MGVLTTADAKALALKTRRRGVIVLAFGADDYALASYGMSRECCSAMKNIANQIGSEIECGRIEVPAYVAGQSAATERHGSDLTADLLTACKKMVDSIDGSYAQVMACVRTMEALIAKAEGQ